MSLPFSPPVFFSRITQWPYKVLTTDDNFTFLTLDAAERALASCSASSAFIRRRAHAFGNNPSVSLLFQMSCNPRPKSIKCRRFMRPSLLGCCLVTRTRYPARSRQADRGREPRIDSALAYLITLLPRFLYTSIVNFHVVKRTSLLFSSRTCFVWI